MTDHENGVDLPLLGSVCEETGSGGGDKPQRRPFQDAQQGKRAGREP
jgi:hypothetical protein